MLNIRKEKFSVSLAKTVKQIMEENGLTDCKARNLKDENTPIVRGELEENYSLTFKPANCEIGQEFQTILRDKRNGKASTIWMEVGTENLPNIINVAKFQVNGTSNSPSKIGYTLAAAIAIGTFFIGFGVGNMINRDSPQSKHLTTLHKTV